MAFARPSRELPLPTRLTGSGVCRAMQSAWRVGAFARVDSGHKWGTPNTEARAITLEDAGSIGQLCRDLRLSGFGAGERHYLHLASIMKQCTSVVSLRVWLGSADDWRRVMEGATLAALTTLTLIDVDIQGSSLAAILSCATELVTLKLESIKADRTIVWPTAPYRTGIRELHISPAEWTATQWRLMSDPDGRGRLVDVLVYTSRRDTAEGDFGAAASALAARNGGIGFIRLKVFGPGCLPQEADVATLIGPVLGTRLELLGLADTAAIVGEDVFHALPPSLTFLTLYNLSRCDYVALLDHLGADRWPALQQLYVDKCGWSPPTYRRIGDRCRERGVRCLGHPDLALPGL